MIEFSSTVLLPFRHLWGVKEALPLAAARFQALGYAGLESHFGTAQQRREARHILEDLGLKNIAMVYSQAESGQPGDVKAHLASLERDLTEALDTAPMCINVHAGHDAWNDDDTLRFFERTMHLIQDLPIPVGFETHRGRCLHTPWRTAAVLEEFPTLRLTLDLSHWVVVCERLPDDQDEALQKAALACVHLHARIGSEQTPQVNDPRAPEHARLLTWFEVQWDRIWQIQRSRGDAFSTLTPEFGPPGYQPTLPFTQMPLSDLDDVCNWVRAREVERFERSSTVVFP